MMTRHDLSAKKWLLFYSYWRALAGGGFRLLSNRRVKLHSAIVAFETSKG